MIRVAISVEGQTEEGFCKNLLTPFFRSYSIELTPVIVMTSKDRCGSKHKGGCININRIESEIKRLLPNFDYVTTFYDFYGFKDRTTDSVDELEKKIYDLFDDRKLIPYVQQYEFETLLFSKPEYYEELFENQIITNKMKEIISEFLGDIEKINDSSQTAPSKRIEKLFDEIGEFYDKVFYGEAIAEDIGLDIIREKARRFDDWIIEITNLSK